MVVQNGQMSGFSVDAIPVPSNREMCWRVLHYIDTLYCVCVCEHGNVVLRR